LNCCFYKKDIYEKLKNIIVKIINIIFLDILRRIGGSWKDMSNINNIFYIEIGKSGK